MTEPLHKPRFPKWLLAVLLVVALVVIGLATWFYLAQRASLEQTARNQLNAVANLKVQQIEQWRSERLADAGAITDNPSSVSQVEEWLDAGQASAAESIRAWFTVLREHEEYSDVTLVDPEGSFLLGLEPAQHPLSPEAVAGVRAALGERRPVLTDLHRSSGVPAIHLDAIAPLFSGSGSSAEPLGAVVMAAEAGDFLYPLIQGWPIPSDTGETLLVRRQGDHVLYLNELRHQQAPALNLTIPLSRSDLPAVAAVLGRTGIFEGRDYRGVEVIASLRSIPDSPWYMVAKMDRSEAFAGGTTRSVLILALAILLILAVVGSIWTYWQLGQKRHYREAYEREKERLALLSRFEHLMKLAGDAILVSDEQSRIVEANDSAAALYGYSREELLGLQVADTIPPEGREAWEERRERLREKGSVLNETVHMRKDGTRFPVEVSSRLIGADGGWYAQAIVRDITQRKRAEEERLQLERRLQQSQRLESLGVMAGGIAHDFNNILMAVLGHADLALSELSPASPGRESLHEIVQASRKAAELCRQMLAYSGRGHFVVEAVDLRGLVEDMVQILRSTISKKILLNLNLEKNLPPVMGDVSQLTQVIMNLVINAAEAIGERSGVITISTGAMECGQEYLSETYLEENLPAGLYVTLEVSDTGSGMDSPTQSRLFEPFFTTKFTGRGLGLSAVLGIVRGHKGALKVYSEEGKGTTFKLLFPAAEGEEAVLARKAGPGAEVWRGTGTVLLVDDEETIRALGKRMLERLGFSVLLACDGREALEMYRERRDEIVLVLLDLTMPHMNGEEAFRELARVDARVRVVMSSGYTENDILSRFSGKGLAGFVQKPYTLDILRDKLREALPQTPPAAGPAG